MPKVFFNTNTTSIFAVNYTTQQFRSCLKLYRQVFYRARIECLFIFKGRIAGEVNPKVWTKNFGVHFKAILP